MNEHGNKFSSRASRKQHSPAGTLILAETLSRNPPKPARFLSYGNYKKSICIVLKLLNYSNIAVKENDYIMLGYLIISRKAFEFYSYC